MSAPKVLFYVQHLLGIGHLKRATTLARAMTEQGLNVTVVSGGEFVPVIDDRGMNFVQLPAIRSADRTFSALVDADGMGLSDTLKTRRRAKLLNLFSELCPQILIIELFPFGRRQLEFELIPLLDAAKVAKQRPVIVSSVRDILVEKNNPHRVEEMVKKAKAYFDRILVHGDPDFITFDKTFPRALELADMLHYTGYVVERQRHASSNETKGKGEVVVSSGSGAVGELLLRSAQRIRPYTYLSDVNWRLLAGHYMDEKVFKSIHDAAVEGVIVERARPDFINLLKNCRLSISQGGYNTVMEVLATGANGIAIPYAGGQETEQTLRVKLMEERGLIRQIPEARLSDKILIDTVNNTQIQKPSKNNRINLDGAIASANLVASWAKELKESYT